MHYQRESDIVVVILAASLALITVGVVVGVAVVFMLHQPAVCKEKQAVLEVFVLLIRFRVHQPLLGVNLHVWKRE